MNPTIRTILLDDETSALANLEELLSAHPQIRIIEKLTDPVSAVSIIHDREPELLFLDIQMPGMNGFELLEELWKQDCNPSIIFSTAYDQFAIEAIRHAAFDFLMKPVSPVELASALERLENDGDLKGRKDQINRLLEKSSVRRAIKISTTGGFTLIRPENILHIAADWNYSEIFLTNRKSEMVTINIGNLEKMLPPGEFFRISRSVIINLAYLSRVNRKKRIAILMFEGQEYPFPIPLLNIRKLEKFLE